jgi:hypothetical protein
MVMTSKGSNPKNVTVMLPPGVTVGVEIDTVGSSAPYGTAPAATGVRLRAATAATDAMKSRFMGGSFLAEPVLTLPVQRALVNT